MCDRFGITFSPRLWIYCHGLFSSYLRVCRPGVIGNGSQNCDREGVRAMYRRNASHLFGTFFGRNKKRHVLAASFPLDRSLRCFLGCCYGANRRLGEQSGTRLGNLSDRLCRIIAGGIILSAEQLGSFGLVPLWFYISFCYVLQHTHRRRSVEARLLRTAFLVCLAIVNLSITVRPFVDTFQEFCPVCSTAREARQSSDRPSTPTGLMKRHSGWLTFIPDGG